jgi:uncharacterized protein YndB with AHSA1/START domain
MAELKITAEPGVPQIRATREFDAPPELVLRAHTDPELVAQWLGPRRYRMTIERWDVRDGGTYRYIHADDDGNEYAFHGVFHGEPSVDSFVQTFEFEGAPGHVSLDTLRLEGRDGRTILHVNSVFQSVEARDAMLGSGMSEGMTDTYSRLDELLAAQRVEA